MRAAGVCLAVLAMLVLHAAPASAHPFGPPQTARVTVDGTRIDIIWAAAEDDWVVLGERLGAFVDPATGAVSTTETGQELLSRSPAVRTYLLDKIRVAQAGRACSGEVVELADLLARGARLRFSCAEAVTEVEITIGALSDFNQAYRTVLTADTSSPRQALFNAANRTHRVRFSASGNAPVPTPLLIAGGLVGAALIAAVPLWRRRRVKVAS